MANELIPQCKDYGQTQITIKMKRLLLEVSEGCGGGGRRHSLNIVDVVLDPNLGLLVCGGGRDDLQFNDGDGSGAP